MRNEYDLVFRGRIMNEFAQHGAAKKKGSPKNPETGNETPHGFRVERTRPR